MLDRIYVFAYIQSMEQVTIFQILSDETRLRILSLMAREGELCVCELVHSLDISQPKISRHLAVMRDAGVVACRRKAQWIFYYIEPSLAPWIRQVLDGALCGIEGEEIIRKDYSRLKAMKNRPEHCRDLAEGTGQEEVCEGGSG